MIDRNSQFMAILTNVGAAKLANANALGIPWNLTALGVGDANGTDPIPAATQTKLVNEQRRAPLNQLRVDPVNSAVIIAEQVIPADVGGWWIREIGLYDSDGDLVAVSNCAPSFKPALDQGSGRTQIVRMNFIVSSITNIVLKIDPAVVLATREYVELAITEALNKQDFKHSVLVATTANILLSGIQTVDGVLLPPDARVLVKDQVQSKDNGIYVVPASGAWRRAQDADASIEVTPGLFVSVEKGTDNGDSVWQLVTDAPIVLGTTALAFDIVAGRTGITASAYRTVTVDKYGRVVAGTNPTTLSGHGITDAILSTPQTGVVGNITDIAKHHIGVYASGTTDGPPTSNGGLFLRMKYPGSGNPAAFDIFGHVGNGYDVFGFRRVLADGSYTYRTVYHDGNFDPSLKANLASPTFTGSVQVPTLAVVTSDQRAASTAFVQATISNIATQVDARTAQATEINQGTAKVATQAMVNVGADDSAFVTAKKLRWGFAASMAANGYLVFPSWLFGFVFQWGVITETAKASEADFAPVSFPIAFPSGALFATGQVTNLNGTAGSGDSWSVLKSLSNTGAQFFGSSNISITHTYGLRWFAFGY